MAYRTVLCDFFWFWNLEDQQTCDQWDKNDECFGSDASTKNNEVIDKCYVTGRRKITGRTRIRTWKPSHYRQGFHQRLWLIWEDGTGLNITTMKLNSRHLHIQPWTDWRKIRFDIVELNAIRMIETKFTRHLLRNRLVPQNDIF